MHPVTEEAAASVNKKQCRDTVGATSPHHHLAWLGEQSLKNITLLPGELGEHDPPGELGDLWHHTYCPQKPWNICQPTCSVKPVKCDSLTRRHNNKEFTTQCGCPLIPVDCRVQSAHVVLDPFFVVVSHIFLLHSGYCFLLWAIFSQRDQDTIATQKAFWPCLTKQMSILLKEHLFFRKTKTSGDPR